MPDQIVKVGEAVVTTGIAGKLSQLQKNDNEDIANMMNDIADLKRFLIHLNGSDNEPATILGHLASIQYVEDALDGLKLTTKCP